ncbi:MAG TPA: AbrB/MazE/SpoVT family DNA-binding domain-containing protein [Actinomycetota bacterium]|nr:AbrB/MazE/SpoVT family DNA-binding domain-containing protein [Actinomycetota bacterium]
MRTITMSPNGRLTLPAEVRQRLGLEGEAEFDVEVTEHGSVTLRPVVVLPRDDAWAYTAEHLSQVAKGLADIREGRVRRLSDADLAAYDD